jgi:predicted amidohydrolase
MKKELHITLVETDLIWENPDANRKQLEQKILEHTTATDVFILPEMFTCGFTMNPKNVAEPFKGATYRWLQELTSKTGAAICGSFPVAENNSYRNRFLFTTPDGQSYTYDKKHSFTLAGEHLAYEAGQEKVLFEYLGWRICPMICYDLRFPVWSRNTNDYDLLIYVANWPKPRINAWDALLKARGIENMSYCIGVNRIGLDGNGHEYPGHSAVYDVLGNQLELQQDPKSGLLSGRLNKNSIGKYRSKLNFLEDRDHFELVEETHK